MKSLKLLIEQLIRENPSGIRRLLYQYSGYYGPLDAEAVCSAYVLYGDNFLWELYQLYGYDHADGQPQQQAAEYNKLSNAFQDAASIITGIGSVAAAASGKNSKPDPQEITQRKIWNGFLITSIGLIVVLGIIALINKRS